MLSARAGATLAAMLAIFGCAFASGPMPRVDVLGVRFVGFGLTEAAALDHAVRDKPGRNLARVPPRHRGSRRRRETTGSWLKRAGGRLARHWLREDGCRSPSSRPCRTSGRSSWKTLRSGILNYRVHGTVTLQGAFGLAVPYSRSGHLDLLAGGLEMASAAANLLTSPCSSPVVVPSRL